MSTLVSWILIKLFLHTKKKNSAVNPRVVSIIVTIS